jgi:hypothetical protein
MCLIRSFFSNETKGGFFENYVPSYWSYELEER